MREAPPEDQRLSKPRILLIRVNSTHELFHTRKAPDILRSLHPDADLLTLATPQTETLALLKNDPRFDQLLIFPTDETGDKSPAALRAFLAGQKIDTSIACFGAEPGTDYARHILSLLLCPGRKLFLDGKGHVFGLASPRGLALLAGAATSLVWKAVAGRIQRGKQRPPQRDAAANPMGIVAKDIRRILWIRLDNIGDVVMSMPAFHALRAAHPDAVIDVAAQGAAKAMYDGLPGVGDVFVYNAPHLLRGGAKPSTKAEWEELARALKQRQYDMAVETRGDAVSRLLAYESGAQVRVGPERGAYEHPTAENRSSLLTIPVAGDFRTRHAVENGLKVVEKCGATDTGAEYRFDLPQGDTARVTAALAGIGVTGPYAIIHGRSTDEMRQWPPDRFAPVADHLVVKHGLDVLLTGAPADREFNETIRAATMHPERVHNAAALVALTDLAALFRPARVMVTVDTGPMHIAAAVGTPIIALFLPWYAGIHHPFGQRDGVLTPFDDLEDAARREHFREWRGEYLTGISVEEVNAAVDNKITTARETGATKSE